MANEITLKQKASSTLHSILDAVNISTVATAQVLPSTIVGTAQMIDSALCVINQIIEPTEEEKTTYKKNLLNFMNECDNFNNALLNKNSNSD